MCWTTKEKPVLKIATEEIKVKKVLTINMNSPYYSKKWEANKVYKLEHPIEPFEIRWGTEWAIEEGFHSCANIYEHFINGTEYLSSSRIFNWMTFTISTFILPVCVFDAVIPKGSEYYENEYGEMVSNKLKIIGKCAS